ncbi:MAG TPA: ABC transporter ATP-binding protein [Candidatus Avimonas sp.]|jgi:branched-chain amino acid transport system ATP-binding protein|nr:ABC transporter ATP-binding protein [Clostridiales bacterium]HOB36304.1 ABC transporter ATP-binding protein [Candidatus Avimonas sp.]HQA15857.1 ABC transporter ATP-binding protein [Candidatus Avimonas sp.]HQD37757.1 ABC transporter ATP-binding protein [Candidatus Avimonas sp.]
MRLLITKDLSIKFGGLQAVNDLHIEVNNKEIVGLIGPNGAGKTTVFNLLTGVYPPSSGAMRLEGTSIIGMKPFEINRYGIARTFQNIRLFKNMTVADNIKVSMQQSMKYHTLSAMFRLPSYWKEEHRVDTEVRELLKIFDMEDVAEQIAANLPYGLQRKLEILRALACKPKILLLDEPAAGMNPTETHVLMEIIRSIRNRFDVAILLIEHDMSLVMNICERVYVLDYGNLIAEGTPEQVRSNQRVITAYLGN